MGAFSTAFSIALDGGTPVVIGAGAAAAIAYLAWATRWAGWRPHTLATLETLTAVAWLAIVLTYLRAAATAFGVKTAGGVTIRP